jgi:hypothetical protein
MGKRAQSAALADELIGRRSEPEFKSLFPSKIDLVKGLNFYARNSDHDDLKSYALQWASANCPEHWDRMSAAAPASFMTFGALARLHSRGMQIEDYQIEKMRNHFASLPPKKVAEESKAKVKKKEVKYNNTYAAAEEYLDAAIYGEKYNFQADPNDDLKAVSEMAKEVLGDVLENEDDYNMVVQLTAALRDIIAKTSTAVKVAKTRKVQARAPRKVNPQKVVEKVKYQKEEISIKQKSLHPIDIFGKKKVYIYDTKYRRVIVFNATEQGFTFKGTTILNVDLAKSYSKRVKQPEALFKPFNGRPPISELNKMFKDIRNKEAPMTTGRFSENFVIIQVS